MKKILSVFVLMIIFSVLLQAQTPQTPQKKIYPSEDKLFINKDLGVYLWLSTSPDPNSEKHRLLSDSSTRYTNPMYFDTEGYNTFRSPSEVDTATKRVIYPLHDIIFEVYADGLPPVTKVKYHYATTRYIDGKRYYDTDLKVELQSSDAVSGVETIWYCLNSNKFDPYKEVLTSFNEGENILRYYAMDYVGNMEDVKEEKFYIDKVPPKTSYQIDGEVNNKYISANAIIKLSSDDNLSGVNTIYYRINNGNFVKYTNPIPAKLLAGNQASITFYAVDNLGNKETMQTIGSKESGTDGEENSTSQNVVFEFYIDKDPPTVDLEVNSDLYNGKYTYISPRAKFTLKADDDKAGVDKIEYNINSSLINTVYKAPFSIENKGLQYLRFRATDYVGNTSTPVVKAYYCDPDPPKSTLTIGNPKFLSRDTIFVSAKTPFSLSGNDDGAGVVSMKYSIDNSELTDYSKSFHLDKNGSVVITYWAEDKVNNREELNRQELYVDNDIPVIHHHFSVESIGNKIVRDENYVIYPANVMLYIAATDKHSGGEKIEYTVNGGLLQTENPIKSFKPGNYLVDVNAYDVLGNKNTQKIKFSVE